jgi:IS30 family transposase
MPKGHALSEATKEGIWELRAQGLSERVIARQLGLGQNTVSHYLRALGGIRPRPRRRAERCLSLEEREEISRGIARGHSARQIALALGRSHTTIAREIERCGGRGRYRAHSADREAWARARRPRPAKLELCPALRRVVEEQLRKITHPSRSPARSNSNTPTMRRCASPTRRSIAPSTSRPGERSSASSPPT